MAFTFLIQQFECLKQFGAGEPKLTGISTALLPLTAARRSEFDTNTEIGSYVQFLCLTGYQFEFVGFLHHNENSLTHLLCEKGKFDIALVLISVADDERVALDRKSVV